MISWLLPSVQYISRLVIHQSWNRTRYITAKTGLFHKLEKNIKLKSFVGKNIIKSTIKILGNVCLSSCQVGWIGDTSIVINIFKLIDACQRIDSNEMEFFCVRYRLTYYIIISIGRCSKTRVSN